jgi:hypothetical protein
MGKLEGPGIKKSVSMEPPRAVTAGQNNITLACQMHLSVAGTSHPASSNILVKPTGATLCSCIPPRRVTVVAEDLLALCAASLGRL